jgi:hypothetical protein
MKVNYFQLFLGLGTYESSRVSIISVTSNIEGGFDTWQEAIIHFRQAIVSVIQLRMEEKQSCFRCKEMPVAAKFCDQCGKPIWLLPVSDTQSINLEAAAWFREWFDLEAHQFSDFDVLEEAGWKVGGFVDTDSDIPVGWVEVSGFDRLLELWDGTTGLSSVDVRTGTFTVYTIVEAERSPRL